MNLRETDIL